MHSWLLRWWLPWLCWHGFACSLLCLGRYLGLQHLWVKSESVQFTVPGKIHSCGSSGIPDNRKYWKIWERLCSYKISNPVLYNWEAAWKVQIRSQMLAQISEICLHESNLALQHASQINFVMYNSSVSWFSILFCMTSVHLSLLSYFLEILRCKCVLVWLPELSAVTQTENINPG